MEFIYLERERDGTQIACQVAIEFDLLGDNSSSG